MQNHIWTITHPFQPFKARLWLILYEQGISHQQLIEKCICSCARAECSWWVLQKSKISSTYAESYLNHNSPFLNQSKRERGLHSTTKDTHTNNRSKSIFVPVWKWFTLSYFCKKPKFHHRTLNHNSPKTCRFSFVEPGFCLLIQPIWSIKGWLAVWWDDHDEKWISMWFRRRSKLNLTMTEQKAIVVFEAPGRLYQVRTGTRYQIPVLYVWNEIQIFGRTFQPTVYRYTYEGFY